MTRAERMLRHELAVEAWKQAAAAGAERGVEEGLERLRRLLKFNARLRHILLHSGIGRERKEGLLSKIPGIPGAARDLALLLARRRALHLLGDVLREYRSLRSAMSREMDVAVFSAVPLSRNESALLARAVEKAAGKRVRVAVRIRKELLGGLMIHLDDMVLDGSLKGAFKRLEEHVLSSRRLEGVRR